MSENLRTVWVLGSGFSKPLGGPMLNELLTVNAADDILGRYPDVDRSALKSVWELYPRGSLLWSDAEDFLSQIDQAERDPLSTAGVRIRRLLGDEILGRNVTSKAAASLAVLKDAALRFVALQCRLFTDDAKLESETWAPYVAWARELINRGGHTIVTFNYDLVPEKLGFQVPPPVVHTPLGMLPLAYKLHGSVGWKRDGDRIVVPDETWHLESCSGDEIGIATPGPTKNDTVRGALEFCWNRAHFALKEAQSIVFVGYRFPPSDSEARTRILKAIGENQSKTLVVNTVLGADVNSPDSRRLSELLRAALRTNGRTEDTSASHSEDPIRPGKRFALRVHPMFSQDFVSIWQPHVTE